jgi:hypothetical protein
MAAPHVFADETLHGVIRTLKSKVIDPEDCNKDLEKTIQDKTKTTDADLTSLKLDFANLQKQFQDQDDEFEVFKQEMEDDRARMVGRRRQER